MTGIELKNKREALGLSQKELATLIGVGKNTIYNYESGGKIPDSKVPILDSVLNRDIETIEHKKTPLKEAGSMEDLLSNAVIEKLKPLLAGVQENHSTMIEGISEMQRQLALVLLDNDELQDHVEDLKEELEFIKRELKRVVR